MPADRPDQAAWGLTFRPGDPRLPASLAHATSGREATRFRGFRRTGIRSYAHPGSCQTKFGRRPTLPGACAPSTIGASGLNFSVRNGKRCTPAAMTAQTVKGRREPHGPSKLHSDFRCSKSRPRAISTGQLSTLLCVHRPPIDVVVFHGPYSLEGMGSLISRWASRLDAFSGYPIQAWLISNAVGTTTDTPEACSSRSSRTRDDSSQAPSAHGG